MEYTQEEKKAYFKGLRFRWEEAKKIADHDAIGAIIKSHGLNISITSFFIVHSQMQAQGLEGLPYLVYALAIKRPRGNFLNQPVLILVGHRRYTALARHAVFRRQIRAHLFTLIMILKLYRNYLPLKYLITRKY